MAKFLRTPAARRVSAVAAALLMTGAAALGSALPAQAARGADSHRPTTDLRSARFPLALESRGARIMRLQQQLLWLGYDISLRELQEARYGATTAKAVEQAQVKFFWGVDRTPSARAVERIGAVAGTIGRLPATCTGGGVVLCIDKTQKVLRYVSDGRVLLTTDVRFGVPGKETPEGDFTVWFRWENAVSRINGPGQPLAPMPYALFFNGDIAVHFSPTFSAYGYYPGGGSHGCVNVASLQDSQWVFAKTPSGTPVHVYSS